MRYLVSLLSILVLATVASAQCANGRCGPSTMGRATFSIRPMAMQSGACANGSCGPQVAMASGYSAQRTTTTTTMQSSYSGAGMSAPRQGGLFNGQGPVRKLLARLRGK